MTTSSCVLALGFTVLLSLSAAQAQTSGGSLPLLPSTEQPARTELLDLVRQIQTQLDALPQNPQNSEQVAALRSELEVLVLQAEVEKLQRDNAGLEASLAGQLQRSTGSNSATPGTSANRTQSNKTPSDMALERRIEQLSEQQSNLNAQLSAMAQQHAEMLEQQLSQDATNPAETASAAAPNSAPAPGSSNADAPTQGQNQVQPQAQTQAQAQIRTQPRVHIVRPGDSLSRLAVTYYGEAARWPDILAANPQITNPNVLFVGTELTIP